MIKYNLIIDSRETKLIELISKKTIENFSVEIKSLKIGDIVISPTDSSDEEESKKGISDEIFYKNSILVFERKTSDDLLASINDGRYREQKARLLANLDKHKICYLIENKLDKNAERYRKNASKIVRGAIINKIFRDDIRYLKTENLEETVEYLLAICKKIVTNLEFFTNSNNVSKLETSSEYTSTIKINKRDNVTFDNYSEMCLTIIPGVSNKIAIRIIEEFKTINNLVSKINSSVKETQNYDYIVNVIGDLTVSITGGKQRRIGKQVAQRIIDLLKENK